MKTSRLADPANSCEASRRRAFAPATRIGNPVSETFPTRWIRRSVAVAVLIATFSIPAAALEVAWDPNAETDISGYQLKYGTSSGVHSNIIATGMNTTASVPGLQEGKTYYFVVTATNQAGLQSAPSNEISYQVPVNAVPIAASASAATMEGTPVSIVLSASDADGGPLTYVIVSGPGNGSLSGTAPNLTYSPNAGFSGSDSFSFRASDGAAISNTATVSITVNEIVPPPNIAPVFAVSPIIMSAMENEVVTGQLNAIDPDETIGLVFAKLSGPSWLTVSPSGLIGGKPSNQDVGTNTFTVRVTDSANASASASLVVTVFNTNDAPVFKSNPITGPEGAEGTPYDGGSIVDMVTDPDAGDVITLSKASGPAWLAISSDGGLSGTPPVGSVGLNTFTVRATDKAGASADAILLITIVSSDLPLPWVLEDLGATGLPHSASYDAGNFTLEGSGQLSGSSDSGCYVWQTLSGDGMITVRLISPGDGNKGSRAGVMIRDSLAANSQYVFMGMDGRGGLCWLRRANTGGPTKMTTKGSGSPPNVWLRLVRKGTTVSAYKSANGSNWASAGSMTTKLGTHCYIGLSVGSGGDSPTGATFSEVNVVP